MRRTDVGIRVHDRLLEVALDLPGERLGHVADGQETVAVDPRRSQDPAAATFEERLFRDLELNPEVLVFVLKLVGDRLQPREFVLVPGAVGPEMTSGQLG